MDIEKLAKQLQGLQTVSSIAKSLNISKRTAINYAWLLRKKGFLKTIYGKRKIRMYKITPVIRKYHGQSLFELINNNSKVKVIVKEDYIIHKKTSIEEVLVRAIATKRFRIILASLGLFNKINDWSKLYKYAIKYDVANKVGALYDIARQTIRVKKMDKRTRKALLKQKPKEKYIVDNIKSKDFKDIEKIWRVYVPFNKADLGEYE